MKFSLGSDNHAGVHPRVLEALVSVNQGHCHSYGLDEITENAKRVLTSQFGDADIYFVFNGTAANVLAIYSLLERHQSVLCTEVSHIHVDECGAPEALTGCKLIPVKQNNGKFDIEDLKKKLIRMGDQHFSQVKMISVTQPTEYGTVYSFEELNELFKIARENNLYMHLDGARLIYAPHALSCDLKEVVDGFDVVSLGATKNGAMGAEAVLLFNDKARNDFKFKQKQFLQLSSKTRFIAQQFTAIFEDKLGAPLWKEFAKNNNETARYLESKLKEIPEVTVTQPVDANAVFAVFPKNWIKPLRDKYFFYVWDQFTNECRLMISFDVTKQMIDLFIAEIRKLKASQ